MTSKHDKKDWSRSYWVLLINQLIVTSVFTVYASSAIHQASQAARAASLELPGLTEWYYTIDDVGILLGGLLSIVVSMTMARFRTRMAATVAASISFSICAVFLCGALFSSIAPLLVAIRNLVSPEDQW